MLELQYIHIPEQFGLLLRSNMQSSSDFYQGLRGRLLQQKDLTWLIKKTCRDLDQNGAFDRIIKAVGWHGLRNRLAYAYVTRALEGYYPLRYDDQGLEDLLTLEQQVQRYSVDGYSRFFLLAFYFKLLYADLRVVKPDEELHRVLKFDEVSALLNLSNARSIKIDWLYLALYHLNSYLGHDRLKTELKGKAKWSELWGKLEAHQQREMMKHFLLYGSSIGDDDFLVTDLTG